jgi:predicted RNA-binding Zn-ribbon protein involved in translation (DUF1610 family)
MACSEHDGHRVHCDACERNALALDALDWLCPACGRTDARAGTTWGCGLCRRRLRGAR